MHPPRNPWIAHRCTACLATRGLPVEIFVPSFLMYGGAVVVQGLAAGRSHEYDEARQTLYVRALANPAPGTVRRICVALVPHLKVVFLVNDFWSD
ncbi:uncharacterized protein PHACADRAFT_195228 [Phanerochaete carnosa HHB-10118-sp]|uniref:Glycoside hydrolase family 5 C-terminal domain-containing protein n=1 Tax=Phanerochaete carnosa (strain HHB-10118-sp) TaxID=650164 RepID=K5UYH7_PHACS|nr:uncharacterized protein PHACADRAFT_195228 [Phanerochaete carnosa HHB-10118-sp]EKM55201.1 hypothetical protein PHACADRAFT_195228 [Phanerochaete carnosa HHB-10118-sp]